MVSPSPLGADPSISLKYPNLPHDPLDDNGLQGVPDRNSTDGLNGSVSAVECSKSVYGSQGGTLIHGCRNQQELLQLLTLVPEDSALKVIPPPGLEPLDALPVLSLGLKTLEILAPDSDSISGEAWIGSVLQGSGQVAGAAIETLNSWITSVLPGGCYRIAIEGGHDAPSIQSRSSHSLLGYLLSLASWMAEGSRCNPADSWWYKVERIEFQVGFAMLWMRRDCAPPISPGPLPSLAPGRVTEVIHEMQNEMNRVFELYSTAYHVAESRRLEVEALLAKIDHSRLLLVRYRLVMARAMAAIQRLLGACNTPPV